MTDKTVPRIIFIGNININNATVQHCDNITISNKIINSGNSRLGKRVSKSKKNKPKNAKRNDNRSNIRSNSNKSPNVPCTASKSNCKMSEAKNDHSCNESIPISNPTEPENSVLNPSNESQETELSLLEVSNDKDDNIRSQDLGQDLAEPSKPRPTAESLESPESIKREEVLERVLERVLEQQQQQENTPQQEQQELELEPEQQPVFIAINMKRHGNVNRDVNYNYSDDCSEFSEPELRKWRVFQTPLEINDFRSNSRTPDSMVSDSLSENECNETSLGNVKSEPNALTSNNSVTDQERLPEDANHGAEDDDDDEDNLNFEDYTSKERSRIEEFVREKLIPLQYSENIKICRICRLMLKSKTFRGHAQYCGRKWIKCPKCRKHFPPTPIGCRTRGSHVKKCSGTV